MSTKDKSSPTEGSKSILASVKMTDQGSAKKGVNGSSAADPDRFNGEGVSFKAKLIGVEDVPEARGDKMCQVSMAKLKAVVVAMKEHKRPISLNVSVEGLRIIDDKAEEILYTHPVHRISFIFRDTSDSRAFGYVYHREDGVHQFFAIKTDKAADITVASIRDLFEIVFARKKKEGDEGTDKKEDTALPAERLDENKNESPAIVQSEQVLEHHRNPPPPPSSDLFSLEDQTAVQQKPDTSQSNAWILNAFSQTNQSQAGMVATGYPMGAYPGQPVVIMGQQPVGFYPGQPQMYQTPLTHQGAAWGAAGVTGPQPTPFSNGYPVASGPMAPGRNMAPRTSTVSGVTFSSPPFANDPFKSDPFFSPVSHTPLSSTANSHGLSFNQSSISSTTSTSGSLFLETSTETNIFNDAFAETPAHQNQSAPKITSQPGPDPFADLANLKLTPTTVPLPPNKKIGKDDFNREPPKPTLLDLSQQQQQSKQQQLIFPAELSGAAPANRVANDPFGMGNTTNPFATITPDDPFA